jgi:iron complex transport system ATP-binding protein
MDEGSFVALVGPNGAGKTTLLRAVLGLVRLDGGTVHIDGRAVSSLSPRERAAHVSWLPQNGSFEEPLTAVEVVAAARYRFSEAHARSLTEAHTALEAVGGAMLVDRLVTELSGGERQRVALAGLLAQKTPLLLLDEPANHLDPAQQIGAYELLGRLHNRGLGILCITHDINLLDHVAEPSAIRVVGLAEGRLAFERRFGDAKLPEELTALFGVPMRAYEAEGRRLIAPDLASSPRTAKRSA